MKSVARFKRSPISTPKARVVLVLYAAVENGAHFAGDSFELLVLAPASDCLSLDSHLKGLGGKLAMSPRYESTGRWGRSGSSGNTRPLAFGGNKRA